MDLKLAGKRALVSGSTAGIGYAIAEALSREGATVIVNGRTRERVDAAIKKIQSAGGKGELIAAPISLATAAGVEQLVQQIPAVDILINNLGIFEPKPFQEIPDADWLRFFEVNVMSGVRLSRAYLPGMKSVNWGRIIFISSESAQDVPQEMIHYGMTKTAQLSIARGLAATTVGTNVTVNSVLPGPTRSEGVEQFVADLAKQGKTDVTTIESDFFKTARPGSLLKRFITPDEIAALVTFVASPLSAATNGAALRAEGGLLHTLG